LELLCVDDLTVAFEYDSLSRIVLDNLSLQLNQGEILSVIGESGSGKSIFSLAIMGLLPPSAKIVDGTMCWYGNGVPFLPNEAYQLQGSVDLRLLNSEQRRQLRARSMSMVFQEPMTALNPTMKCGVQIEERIKVMKSIHAVHAIQDVGRSERYEVKPLLEEVELTEIERMINSYPHQLSGGQRQRLMLAMALVGEPQLLIADEPTTALDARVQASILQLLKRLVRSRGLSMLLISHDLGLVDQMSDDVLVLRKGKTMEYGAIHKVLKHPQSTYTQALLGSRLDPSKKDMKLAVLTDEGELTAPEPWIRPSQPQEEEEEHRMMLDIKGLTVRYPLPVKIWSKRQYHMALESIDLHIANGKTLGLVGESGSGKSTLSRVLVGLTPANGGEIRLNGTVYQPHTIDPKKRARMVQMIFQDPYGSLNPSQKIGDILSEVVWVHRLRPKNALRARVTELLDAVGLGDDFSMRYPSQLSGGQRQRVVIARALAAEPMLLVCDESVSALDVSVQAQVLNLLKSLQQSLRLTYLFISHDLSVVYHMSDEIAVLHHGKIVELKKASELYSNPEHPYTRQLLASTMVHSQFIA
jgi:ABC-type glutathione transport system ATPase component